MSHTMAHAETSVHGMNVGTAERLASIAAGGILVTRFFQKRTAGKILAAVVGADLLYRGISGYSPMYQAMGINTALKHKSGSEIDENAPHVRRSITIEKSPEELYALWSDPQNVSRVMAQFAQVTITTDGANPLLHWRMRTPIGTVDEWDSHVCQQEAGRMIAWESMPETPPPNHGEVKFKEAPNGFGTEVTLHMQFEPPLGAAGARIMRNLRKIPRTFAGQALRRFKSLAETGEIPTLAHNPSGRGASDMS